MVGMFSQCGVNERSNVKKFWVVTRDPSEVSYHNPVNADFTKEAARKKAEGLVKKTGHKFYILEAMEVGQPSTPPVEWQEIPEVRTTVKPFRFGTQTTTGATPARDSLGRFVSSKSDPYDDYQDWVIEDEDEAYYDSIWGASY